MIKHFWQETIRGDLKGNIFSYSRYITGKQRRCFAGTLFRTWIFDERDDAFLSINQTFDLLFLYISCEFTRVMVIPLWCTLTFIRINYFYLYDDFSYGRDSEELLDFYSIFGW